MFIHWSFIYCFIQYIRDTCNQIIFLYIYLSINKKRKEMKKTEMFYT